jgi:hypothetical protein
MLQVPPLHTPEEMQQISNLAHQVEGAVLGLAAVIALVQATGRWSTGPIRFLWPGLILGAGIFLLGYLLLPHHGLHHALDQWGFIFGDPQQRQHLVLAVLITVAGAAEVLHLAGRVQAAGWAFVWPGAALVAGGLFLLHTQHGTTEAALRAGLVHRYLGVLLIASGVLKAAEVLWSARARWLAFPWVLTLFAAALLLAAYREPEGAYREEHGTHTRRPQP